MSKPGTSHAPHRPKIAPDPFFSGLFSSGLVYQIMSIINRFYANSVMPPLIEEFFHTNALGAGITDTQMGRFHNDLLDPYKGFMRLMKNDRKLHRALRPLLHDFFRASGAAAVFGIPSHSELNSAICGSYYAFPHMQQGMLIPKNPLLAEEFSRYEYNHDTNTHRRHLTDAFDSGRAYVLGTPDALPMFERLKSFEGRPVIIFDDSYGTGLAKATFLGACIHLNIDTSNFHFLSLVREQKQAR